MTTSRSRDAARLVAEAEHATVFRIVVGATSLLLLIGSGLVILAQPSTVWRGVGSMALVVVIGIVSFVVSRSGRTAIAAWIFLACLLTLLAYRSWDSGGVHSPAVHLFPMLVVLGGLLLGRQGATVFAAASLVVGFGFLIADQSGTLPGAAYVLGTSASWFFSALYVGVALYSVLLFLLLLRRALTRAEAELARQRATKRRLEHVLERSGIGIFEYDVRSGSFTGDERVALVTGLEIGDGRSVALSSLTKVVHPDDRAAFALAVESLKSGGATRMLSFRAVRSASEVRDVVIAAYAERDEAESVRSIVGTIADVTEGALAAQERERLVHDLAERVKELGLLHRVAILLRDRSFGLDLLQELAIELTAGWQYPDVCEARVRFGDMEARTQGWRRSPWSQVETFHTSDGDGLVEVGYMARMPDADDGPFLREERTMLQALVEMLRLRVEEVASVRRRESAEARLRHSQKLEALGTLAGGIAHDFNNILTAIGGFGELALEQLSSESEAAKGVREILKAHTRARDLVRRILLFSRFQESEKQRVCLVPVIEEALQLLRSSLPPGIAIETSLSPETPMVWADPAQIHQVVMNLGANAAHAMRDRGGVMTVSLAADVMTADDSWSEFGDARPCAHFRVRDSGPGMSPEVLERVFEPFFTTKGASGTGLGLSVVHGIVKEHGGQIVVESSLGRGASFDIRLPAELGASTAVSAAETRPMLVPGQGQMLLVVDDEATVAALLDWTLTRLGYRCVSVSDPAEAVRMFSAAPTFFDAVVADVRMPGMSGVEMASVLAQMRPGLPVVLVSGFPGEETGEIPHAAMTIRLDKPWTQAGLSSAVARLFG